MTEALSSWLVMAPGRGSILANSKNSKFSFPRRERAALRDFSLRRFWRLREVDKGRGRVGGLASSPCRKSHSTLTHFPSLTNGMVAILLPNHVPTPLLTKALIGRGCDGLRPGGMRNIQKEKREKESVNLKQTSPKMKMKHTPYPASPSSSSNAAFWRYTFL
ncbi:hypothetical protein EYF80_056038 [Liparis tanakae]|uniref:Uncharacterized protein n=1 Tax=Liparis tanakae TaxID=230148 RepID=A0A4Z2EZ49_9TELE|nr:hypothetical protein EYF80_056038 [Liparis tanakae]